MVAPQWCGHPCFRTGRVMKRAGFDNIWLPVALLLPQLMIIAIFFYWPAGWALQSSFFLQDPFGFGSTFVGPKITRRCWAMISTSASPGSRLSSRFWSPFSRWPSRCCWRQGRQGDPGAKTYRTLLMWVYAIAPPVAGFLGILFFDQSTGPMTKFFQACSAGISNWASTTTPRPRR